MSGKRSPLVASPCGSGKTIIFCHLAKATQSKGKRILILTHRAELIDQIGETLRRFDVRHGFIAPNKPVLNAAVQVGSVFSVVRKLNRLTAPDLIIIDEAHHCIARSTFGRVLTHWRNAYRIGVTATPQRLSGEPLSDMFDDLIIGPSVRELTELGALSPYKLFAPSTIQTENIHMRGGDYAKKEITAAADKPAITGDAVSHYIKLGNSKRAVAFCCSVEHAKHVATQFRGSGISAVSIDGSLNSVIRAGIIKDFKEGRIQVLTSCDIISEGYDCPAIEVAIMLRPTASLALHIQQSGRALRPYEGKTHATILDHAGNVFRHGLPDDERSWTLEGRETNKKANQSDVQVRTCGKCFAALREFITTCPHCGYVFPVVSREIQQVEGTLEEIDLEAHRKQARREQGSAQTVEQLIKLGYARGYKSPEKWAYAITKARENKRANLHR